MKIEQVIFKNTVVLTTAKIIGDLCSFLFLAYMGRIFGASILGTYSLAMAIGGLMSVLSSFGFNTLIVRDISRQRSKNAKFTGNFVVVRGVVSIFFWFLFALVLFFYPDGTEEGKAILIFIVGYHVFYRLAGLFRSSFVANEEMQYSAFLEIFHRVVILFIGGTLVFLFHSPILALSIYPVSSFIMFLLGWKIFNRIYGVRPDCIIDFVFIKKSVVQGLPFLVIVLLYQFYDRIGILILAGLKGDVATGIYSASDRILATFSAVMLIFHTALLPAMTKLSISSREKAFTLCKRAFRVILVLLIPFCFILSELSPHIISVTFGDAFIESSRVFKVSVWALLFMGLNYILGGFFIATDRQKVLIIIQTISYATYAFLCVIIGRELSYIGIAWAKVITESVLLLFGCYYAFDKSELVRVVKIAVPALMCGLVSFLMYGLHGKIPEWFIVPLIIICYTVILWSCGGIKKGDILFLKGIITGSYSAKV